MEGYRTGTYATVFAMPLDNQTPPESATCRCQSAHVRVNQPPDCLFTFGNNGYERRDCLQHVMRLNL